MSADDPGLRIKYCSLEPFLDKSNGGAPRCQHILRPSDRKSAAPDGPRQCRKAATRGRNFCDQHGSDA